MHCQKWIKLDTIRAAKDMNDRVSYAPGVDGTKNSSEKSFLILIANNVLASKQKSWLAFSANQNYGMSGVNKKTSVPTSNTKIIAYLAKGN